MTMDIEIRLAKVEDRAEILQLQSSSLRVLASKDYGPEEIESLVRSQAKARFYSEVIFVAICQEKIVGFASLLIHKYQIGGVYVHPEFSRQGIGSRLLEVVENTAIEKGYKSLSVLSSLTAIDFYQKQGYQMHSHRYFWSEEKVSILSGILNKRLIEAEKSDRERIAFSATENSDRRIWVLALALIVVVSIAIALL